MAQGTIGEDDVLKDTPVANIYFIKERVIGSY